MEDQDNCSACGAPLTNLGLCPRCGIDWSEGDDPEYADINDDEGTVGFPGDF